jgi:hypothetical protein
MENIFLCNESTEPNTFCYIHTSVHSMQLKWVSLKSERPFIFAIKKSIVYIYIYHSFQTGSGAHPASIQWVAGAHILGAKWLWCEGDLSPPPSAKVMRAWSYTFIPQSSFITWFLIKHRHNFAFFLSHTHMPPTSLDVCVRHNQFIVEKGCL